MIEPSPLRTVPAGEQKHQPVTDLMEADTMLGLLRLALLNENFGPDEAIGAVHVVEAVQKRLDRLYKALEG